MRWRSRVVDRRGCSSSILRQDGADARAICVSVGRPTWHVEQIGIYHQVASRARVAPPRMQASQARQATAPSGPSGSRPSYPLRLAPSLLPLSALPRYLGTHLPASAVVSCSTQVPCTVQSRVYPCTGAVRRPAIAEPRPRPSGIGKDPRPFTSNPRNPPFTFPHPTLLSLGPAASPPLSRFLSACRSLFGALPSGSPPTTALRHPAKPQNPPFESSAISLHAHALSHAASVLTTLRPADSRRPRNPHNAARPRAPPF